MSDQALEHLGRLGIEFEVVEYGPVRSAEEAATARGIRLDQLVKTLVVRRGDNDYLFVLIAGNTSVDWKKLRTALGVRRLTMPSAAEARNATGYERGTITPLGAFHQWPLLADERVAAAGLISLGSGVHGRAVNVDAAVLLKALNARTADVAD